MICKLNEIFHQLKAKEIRTLSVAVAEDKVVLKAVAEAVNLGIIKAILVGDKDKILSIMDKESINFKYQDIVDEKDINKAAAKAVELVSSGKADYLMKGLLNTSDLLKAALNKEYGVRGTTLLSHVMVYEVESYHKLIILTDGGMVPYPNITEKVDIIKNAVHIAHKLGNANPKVAPLCAVESVNPSMQATIDAAMLSQMNKRGQIKNCIIDGPLALDNAVSKEAAEHKGIVSPVAGDSDIFLVPNIEAGNLLGKSLTYFAKAESAGIIVGAKCPIVLVSRADSAKSKLYSIALGALVI